MIDVSIYKHQICRICHRHSDMPSRWERKGEVTARALGIAHHVSLESADISKQIQQKSPGGTSVPGLVPVVAEWQRT